MKINNAFILAAGLGTRMGEQGKILAKPLWKIMGREMLGLQIDYFKSLGAENIFVNIHHLPEQMNSYLSHFYPDVKTVFEENLLGSGGAIHNLAKEFGPKGNLLISNADTFFIISKEKIEEGLRSLDAGSKAILYAVKVSQDSTYNRLVVENDYLVDIEKENFSRSDITYSGFGLVNMDLLDLREGRSSFFETVANYKVEQVRVILPQSYEYWDFGTKELYSHSQKLLLRDSSSKFKKFLHANEASLSMSHPREN